MVLFGLESANQYTLDMVNKGVKVEDIKLVNKKLQTPYAQLLQEKPFTVYHIEYDDKIFKT